MLKIVWMLLAVYLGLGILLFIMQRSLIYFPTPPLSHHFEEQTLAIDGEQIKLIVVNPGMERALLYFGGNAEAVAWSAPELASTLPEYTLYLLNYRGYGGSSGKPSEAAIYSDALSVWDTVAPRHSSVAIMGRSLGSAVATQVAANRPVKKLVLVTPFDSVLAIAQGQFPIYPIGMLLKDHHDSLARVSSISADTLIMVAEKDEVIAAARSQSLVDAFAPSQLTTNRIDGAGHNTVSDFQAYYHAIKQFLLSSP